MSLVEDGSVTTHGSRTRAALVLAVLLTVVGAFVVGLLVGSHREPSEHLRVDREVSGTVVKVGAGDEAVVIETEGGTESFRLLGDAPAPGDHVEGTVVELVDKGVSVEAVVLH